MIWRSKTPRCFQLASAADKLGEVMYFAELKILDASRNYGKSHGNSELNGERRKKCHFVFG